MFQRFTSILFGDSLEEGSGCPVDPDFNEKEEDDEWILVDYLGERSFLHFLFLINKVKYGPYVLFKRRYEQA